MNIPHDGTGLMALLMIAVFAAGAAAGSACLGGIALGTLVAVKLAGG